MHPAIATGARDLEDPRLRATVEALDPPNGGAVLQVGLRSVRTLEALSLRHALGLVAGVDRSEPQVRAAKRWLAPRRGMAALRLEVADVIRLPFADESFDLILALEGCGAWPDGLSALAEMAGVLKPGGEVVLSLGEDGAAAGEWAPLMTTVGLRPTVHELPLGDGRPARLIRGRKASPNRDDAFILASTAKAKVAGEPGRPLCVRCFSLRP
jgi:SAM-dependent methyltransferase